MVDAIKNEGSTEVRFRFDNSPQSVVKAELEDAWKDHTLEPHPEGEEWIFELQEDPSAPAATLENEVVRLKKKLPELAGAMLKPPYIRTLITRTTTDSSTILSAPPETTNLNTLLDQTKENMRRAFSLKTRNPVVISGRNLIVQNPAVIYVVGLYPFNFPPNNLEIRIQAVRAGSITGETFQSGFRKDTEFYNQVTQFVPNYLWN